MLSFLSPLFLAGAAAAAVPIVLHLLKREPEARLKFAAVKLIKQAPVEYTDRRRLRELLLLALRVTALVLLALAFARPFLATGAAVESTGVTVIALDTSYSLAAPGRFERAKQLAKEAVVKAPAGDLVGVVTFSDEAEIVAKPGTDRSLATDAIEQASPGFGATRYRTALSAASQHLAGRHGTVVVVTDLQENGWDAGDRASVPEGTTIQVADVGAMPPNLAVTAVRPLPDRVVATVHNGSARPRDARVHLRIDNRPAGDAMVSLGANQSADATFAGAPRGASAAVSVDDADGIQADNIRYAVIGGTGKPSVLLITGSGDANRDAFYVQHALAAGTPADAAFQVAGAGGANLAGWSEDRLTPHAAVLLLSTRGLERRGRELLAAYAQHGGGLFIAAGPEVDGDVVADVLGAGSTLRIATVEGAKPAARALAPADGRHPVFQAFAGNPADAGAIHHRRHRAHRVPGGRGARADHGVRLEQSLERFSLARDLRAVRARGRALPGERARPLGRLPDRRRAGRRPPRAGHCRADRRSGRRRHAHDRGQRRSARGRSGAAVGRRVRVGGDEAEGRRWPRNARRGAGARGSAAPVALRARRDGLAPRRGRRARGKNCLGIKN
jgi:hypothetical protein